MTAKAIENLVQDLRYELRRLRKAPGFAFVTVATLALGIGATTAIFSVVNAVLFHPLPHRQPNAIVRLQEFHEHPANLTGATFRDVRQGNHVFSYVAVYRIFSQKMSDSRQTMPPEQIDAAFVSHDFLPLLGISLPWLSLAASMMWTFSPPWRLEMSTICRPSGDHAAS